jgi:hypothetical protein
MGILGMARSLQQDAPQRPRLQNGVQLDYADEPAMIDGYGAQYQYFPSRKK